MKHYILRQQTRQLTDLCKNKTSKTQEVIFKSNIEMESNENSI